MTSQNTPTKAPISAPVRQKSTGVGAHSSRARDVQRPPQPRRSSSWLVWVGIAAALAAAIWLVLADVTADYDAAPSARASQAATARLQGLADQYEAAP